MKNVITYWRKDAVYSYCYLQFTHKDDKESAAQRMNTYMHSQN